MLAFSCILKSLSIDFPGNSFEELMSRRLSGPCDASDEDIICKSPVISTATTALARMDLFVAIPGEMIRSVTAYDCISQSVCRFSCRYGG